MKPVKLHVHAASDLFRLRLYPSARRKFPETIPPVLTDRQREMWDVITGVSNPGIQMETWGWEPVPDCVFERHKEVREQLKKDVCARLEKAGYTIKSFDACRARDGQADTDTVWRIIVKKYANRKQVRA